MVTDENELNCPCNDCTEDRNANEVQQSELIDGSCSEEKQTFQYVPILQLLKKLLTKPEIWESIQRQKELTLGNSNSDLLTSFRDAEISKSHAIFGTDPSALQIHLYCDEFEVCNPIGVHRTQHKLTAIYFFLGNLEKQYHSQLQNIYLVLLVKHKFIKNHSKYVQVLRPLINDLKLLQTEGISVNINGYLHTIRGALATVSADNLSAHDQAGFQCSFNPVEFVGSA